jgi:glucose/arabinose dehydrogenase
LTGIPFTENRANIYRLDPATDAVPHTFTLDEAFLTGFTTIIDIAFDDDGALYVLQYATGTNMSGLGVLRKVVPDMSQSDIRLQYQLGTRSTVIAGLHEPTSVAIGRDGNLYVSIRGTTAAPRDGSRAGGEVIRVQQD